MNAEVREISVNGVDYVRKDSIAGKVTNVEGLEYCIVRTYSAGVFAGFVEREKGSREATVYNARRLWRWAGAASLSQLATQGTSKPDDCKFPVPVPEVILTEVIEIVPCSETAKNSIEGVVAWVE